MRKYSILAIFFLILVYASSCKEVFYPDDLGSPERILVIDGIITEGSIPVVNCSWSMGYDEETPEYLSGATVYVTDNEGNQVYLLEVFPGSGDYTPLTDDFIGISGNIYTLHVISPDGDEYVSNPVKIHEKPIINSLYADPSTRIAYTYNLAGNLISQKQEGLYVLSDLINQDDSVRYYRFSSRAIREITFIKNPGTLQAKSGFLWETIYLNEVYNVNYSVPADDEQVVMGQEAGFLKYEYNPLIPIEPPTSIPRIMAWIVIHKVYAITSDVYEYYHTMKQQLASNNQIFAPVPSQVKGNITCVNNSGKRVAGVFEASSVNTVYKAFQFIDAENYDSKDLVSFPEDVHSGDCLNFPPSFWVTF